MKTKTLDLAEDWGLEIVEVTKGKNGYPEGLYKAIVGFDYFKNAEDFAKQVNGEVVFLSRYVCAIHDDDDVTTYMIAVVDHETDGDEANEED